MEAVEWLLRKGYKPKRTIYLAYGHDEEINGQRGAKRIAELLASRDVKLEYVLDEGGTIMAHLFPIFDKPVALIGVSEKGYVSFDLIVRSKGGHSSMPPRETATGILAKAICKIEANPFPAKLTGATLRFFQTIGAEMPFWRKILIANLWLFAPLLKYCLARIPSSNAAIRTTEAVTMLKGSHSDNVLPQKAKAVVNIRLFPGDTVKNAKKYLKKVIKDKRVKIDEKWECGISDPMPTSSENSFGYEVIEKSIREIFPKTIVSPFMMTGITDSRHYSSVSKNIYRFLPLIFTQEDLDRVHSKNERISIENYKKLIRFYIQLIENS